MWASFFLNTPLKRVFKKIFAHIADRFRTWIPWYTHNRHQIFEFGIPFLLTSNGYISFHFYFPISVRWKHNTVFIFSSSAKRTLRPVGSDVGCIRFQTTWRHPLILSYFEYLVIRVRNSRTYLAVLAVRRGCFIVVAHNWITSRSKTTSTKRKCRRF